MKPILKSLCGLLVIIRNFVEQQVWERDIRSRPEVLESAIQN
jgi:hypothetical protein